MQKNSDHKATPPAAGAGSAAATDTPEVLAALAQFAAVLEKAAPVSKEDAAGSGGKTAG